MTMFLKNYLNELPEDCVRIIYKYVLKFSISDIEEREYDNVDNELYISTLKDFMNDICIQRKKDEIEDSDFDSNNEFPFNQIVYWGKSTGEFERFKKSPYIDAEVYKLSKEDRVRMNLVIKRKLFAEQHFINCVKVYSDIVSDFYAPDNSMIYYANCTKECEWIDEQLNQYDYVGEWDNNIGRWKYKIRIVDGVILFHFIDSQIMCMAEFLICFKIMFAYMEERFNELRNELIDSLEGGCENVDNGAKIQKIIDCLNVFTDDMTETSFLNTCDMMKLSNEKTVIVTNRYKSEESD